MNTCTKLAPCTWLSNTNLSQDNPWAQRVQITTMDRSPASALAAVRRPVWLANRCRQNSSNHIPVQNWWQYIDDITMIIDDVDDNEWWGRTFKVELDWVWLHQQGGRGGPANTARNWPSPYTGETSHSAQICTCTQFPLWVRSPYMHVNVHHIHDQYIYA